MERKYCFEVQEVLKVDYSNVVNGFQQVKEWVDQIDQKQEEFKEEYNRSMGLVQLELKRLPKIEEDLIICLRGAQDIQKIRDTVDSWSERFMTLEEKCFIMQHDFNERVGLLEKSIEAQEKRFNDRIELQGVEYDLKLQRELKSLEDKLLGSIQNTNDKFDKRINQFTNRFDYVTEELKDTDDYLESKMKEEINLAMVNIMSNVQQDLKNFEDQHDLVDPKEEEEEQPEEVNQPSVHDTPIQQRRIQFMDPVSPSKFAESGSVLSRKIKKLQKSIDLMQDKINYLLPDDPTGQRNLCDNIYTLDINIPHEKDNLIHEFHLKYVVLIKEINNLKDLFKIIKPVDPPADIIKPERIPNYQHYQPYMTRIQNLEESKSLFVDQNQFADLINQIENLGKQLQSKANIKDIVNQNDRIGDIAKTIGLLEQQTYARQQSEPQQEIEQEQTTEEQDELKDVIFKIQQALQMKLNRGEISNILQSYFAQSKGDTNQSSDDHLSSFQEFKDRLNKMYVDGNQQKQYIEEQIKLLYQRIEEQTHQLKEIAETRNTQQQGYNQSPEQIIQNYQIIQQEQIAHDNSELQTKIQILENQINKLTNTEISKEDLKSTNPQMNRLYTIINKQDKAIIALKNQMGKLLIDLENSNQSVTRLNEITMIQNVEQLDSLQKSVTLILNKIKEGTRLNQNDMNKLNEVYTLIEGKGDKQEIMQKVDRQELKRAHRFLLKKIEIMQQDLKQSQQNKQDLKEDPAIIRKKLINTECLACGQEVSQIPVYRKDFSIWGRFPGSNVKLGPGFSKILPLLTREQKLEISSKSPHLEASSQEQTSHELSRVKSHRYSLSIDKLYRR